MITNTYNGNANFKHNNEKEIGLNHGIGMPWNYPFLFPYHMFGKNDNVVPVVSHNVAVPWPLNFQDKSVQYNLNKLVSVIRESIMDEESEVGMYDSLANMAPSEEQKNIILKIAENEATHGTILKKLFQELTGSMWSSNVPNNPDTKINKQNNLGYTDMLKKVFMSELKAIEKYRELLAYAPTKDIYSMLFYIFSDEIRHSSLYNYLITQNITMANN